MNMIVSMYSTKFLLQSCHDCILSDFVIPLLTVVNIRNTTFFLELPKLHPKCIYELENIEALRNELRSNYHQLVASFEVAANSVKSDTLKLILLFSFSLIICFIGLFYTSSGVGGNVWLYIAFALSSITSAMLYFNGAWTQLQILSDDLDKELLTLSAAVRIYGKIAEDIKKATNAGTEE